MSFTKGGINTKLIIAEKPSVAKNIADALTVIRRNNGYIECRGYLITWAFGHLLELYDAKDYDGKMSKWKQENFPFIPNEFKYKIKADKKNKNKVDSGVKKQLEIINDLIKRKDIESIISAFDFDREGQIIGDIILNYLGNKKPVYRLLLNEWTPNEVLASLNKLKPNSEFKNTSDAGICRQRTDWVIGINLTSMATLKYNKGRKGPLNIGRVILPAVKIVYDRDKEIQDFKSKDYFKLIGEFETKNKEIYEGVYYKGNNDKFLKETDLKNIINLSKNKNAVVVKKETGRKKEYPPYLFNLAALQGFITSKYSGWTSAKVLKTAQFLYEKKYITYPRTVSFVLEESLGDKAKKVLNTLKKGLPYENEIKFVKSSRIFNSKKVEGHSAIIPTYIIPTGLTKDESIVYSEIRDRFLMQFMPLFEYDETTISTKVNEKSITGIFVTKGKTVIDEGWKKVQNNNSKDILLPEVKKGEAVNIKKLTINRGKTKPPAHHTEKTLTSVMETAGRGYNEITNDDSIMSAVLSGFRIGTPATWADTIEKIKKVGYVEPKGKSLIITRLGKSLVENFPVKDLFNLEYTGRLEKTLSDIEKGEIKKDEFLDFIYNFTKQSVEKIKKDGGVIMGDNLENDNVETLGLCPECGEPVVENSKAFGCSGWKEGCKFAIWKDDRFLSSMKKKPTKEMVKKLLKDGEVEVKGLVSKKGNTFDAILSYKKNIETGYYNWNMKFPEKEKTEE